MMNIVSLGEELSPDETVLTLRQLAVPLVLSWILAVEVEFTEKVIQMMSDLEDRIIAKGTEAQKTYDEFAESPQWTQCRRRMTCINPLRLAAVGSSGLTNESGTKRLPVAADASHGVHRPGAQSGVADLSATTADESAKINADTSKIDDLSADIAADDADLTAKENELTEAIDMAQHAVAILEKELTGGVSMMQLKCVSNLEQALEVTVRISAISRDDSTRLAALVQTQSDDSDSDMGAPETVVCEGKSVAIADTPSGTLGRCA